MIGRKYVFGLIGLFWVLGLRGQSTSSISLQEAYEKLEQRYPALQDDQLLRQIEQEQLDLIEAGRLPEIALKGDGRLQSTSTRIEGDNTPIEIQQPLVGVKTYLEANYILLDGGLQEIQKQLTSLEFAADQQQIEVQKFALRKNINQLFFQTTLLRTQEALFSISLQDLATRKESLQAGIENGVLLESELTKLEIKQLELESQKENIQFRIDGTLATLEDWLDIDLADDVVLEYPAFPNDQAESTIARPEQELFDKQKAALLAKAELIDIKLKPKVNLFAQGGIGYPNPLNILDNGVAPYGLIGAGFTWTIKDWDKTKKEKSLLALQAQRIENAAETFDFNLDKQTAFFQSEVDRLYQQIEKSRTIASLQEDLLNNLAAQLDGGVITATDYLLQVNAELAARQKVAILEAELLSVRLNYWNERGAF